MLSSSGVRSSHRPPESRTHSWAAAAACRASRYADRAPTAPPVSASSITPARSCDTDANGDEDRQSAHLMRRAISQAEACNHQRPSAPSAECAPRRQARSGTHGAARTGRRRCGSKTQGASSPAGHAVAERSAPPPPPSTLQPTYPSPPPSTPTPHSSPPSARALGHRPEGQTRMVRLELPAVPRDCTMACRQRRRRLERVWSGTRRSRGRWPAGVITVSILHLSPGEEANEWEYFERIWNSVRINRDEEFSPSPKPVVWLARATEEKARMPKVERRE